jgi:hypothetical protein
MHGALNKYSIDNVASCQLRAILSASLSLLELVYELRRLIWIQLTVVQLMKIQLRMPLHVNYWLVSAESFALLAGVYGLRNW